jgi:hypothetical protein
VAPNAGSSIRSHGTWLSAASSSLKFLDQYWTDRFLNRINAATFSMSQAQFLSKLPLSRKEGDPSSPAIFYRVLKNDRGLREICDMLDGGLQRPRYNS